MSLRRANHSSRGVLATVVRRYMWSWHLENEEALAHRGAVAQIEEELLGRTDKNHSRTVNLRVQIQTREVFEYEVPNLICDIRS